MHGRSSTCLLAGLFLLRSVAFGQSVDALRDAAGTSSYSNPPTRPSNPHRRALGNAKAGSAEVSISSVPITPRLPLPPAPIPDPLPWRLPISSAPSAFARIVRSSGTIFAGTVANIQRASENIPGQAVGVVEITFHVEKAIRGARSGESLTIAQWMGIWSSGQRYRVGERVLLFLYPRSRIGLTSCVGAGMGRFAIDPSGRVWLSEQQILAFQTDPVLGGKSRALLSDFASAVRWAGEEE